MDQRVVAFAILLLAVVATADDFVASTSTSTQAKVVVVGRKPNFRFYPSSSSSAFVGVKFGRVAELDANGRKVPAHTLQALVDVTAAPSFSNGTLTVDGTLVSFARLEIPLSNLGTSFLSCATSARRLLAGANGFLAITAYYNFANDVRFPYGAGNTVLALANSVKFNIEASNWPFCSTSNSLLVELDMETSRADYSYPVLLSDSNVEASATFNSSASIVTSSETTSSRRLLVNAMTSADLSVTASGSSSSSSSSSSVSASSSTSASNSASGGSSASGSVLAGGSSKPKNVYNGGDKPAVPSKEAKRMKDERCKMAKLLVSADAAASLNLQTYAYNAANGTVQSNVTVAMVVPSNYGTTTRVLLRFPYFASTLYYDPAVEFQSAAEAGYDTTAVTQADNTAKNGAVAASGSVLLLVLCALVALLL